MTNQTSVVSSNPTAAMRIAMQDERPRNEALMAPSALRACAAYTAQLPSVVYLGKYSKMRPGGSRPDDDRSRGISSHLTSPLLHLLCTMSTHAREPEINSWR